MKKFCKKNFVPLFFILLSILGFIFSGMSMKFVVNEMINRFIRNGIMVLALIIPIIAGLGLNFAITIGALCAQVGFLIVLDYQISGYLGIIIATLIGVILSYFAGYIIGNCLNKVKGKEMITTIIIGFLGTSIYQLIFMVGYGTIIKSHNPEIVLSRGIGVRNMVDMEGYRSILDKLLVIKIGSIQIPVFMILLIIIFALIIKYLINTPKGMKFRAIGEDMNKARDAGINVEKVRIDAIIISTITACFAQIIYLQNIGMMSVYTAHTNSEIFACASILAGGATINKASVKNAFLGIFLFHFLFIVSPQAGQNLFQNVAVGEYFRTFIAYGTIAGALLLNSTEER